MGEAAEISKGPTVFHYIEAVKDEYDPEDVRRFKSDLNYLFRRKYVLEHPHQFPDEMVDYLSRTNDADRIKEYFEKVVKPNRQDLNNLCDRYAKTMVGKFVYFVLSRNRNFDLNRHDPRAFVEMSPLQWAEVASTDLAMNKVLQKAETGGNIAEFRLTRKKSNEPYMMVSGHGVHALYYHIWFNAKYRLPVFQGKNAEEIKKKIIDHITGWSARNHVIIVNMSISSDHIHLLARFHMKTNPQDFLSRFKREISRYCKELGIKPVKGSKIFQGAWGIKSVGHSTVDVIDYYIESHSFKDVSEDEIVESFIYSLKKIFQNPVFVKEELQIFSSSRTRDRIDLLVVTKPLSGEKRITVFVCEFKRQPVNEKSFSQVKSYICNEQFWNVVVADLMKRFEISHPTAVRVVGLMIAPGFVGHSLSNVRGEREYTETRRYFLDYIELKHNTPTIDKDGKIIHSLDVAGLQLLDSYSSNPVRPKNVITIPLLKRG